MSGLNPIEELHDRLSDLELNIIEHLDRNAQFARKQEKRLVELFHIDPTTISREPLLHLVKVSQTFASWQKI